MNDKTTVLISKEVRDKLYNLKKREESYDDLLLRLINERGVEEK